MKARIFRWIVAIGLWGFGVYQFTHVLDTDGGIGGAGPLILGFAAFIAGLVLVSGDVVKPLAGLFGDFLVALINPGTRLEKAPLSYVLAHRYRDQMRLEEAAEEYWKIIHDYPNERAAYEELIAIARDVGDHKTVEDVTRKYRRKFGSTVNPALPPTDE